MSLGATLTLIILSMYIAFITLRLSSPEDATNWLFFFIALITVTFDSSFTNLQLHFKFFPLKLPFIFITQFYQQKMLMMG